MSIPQQPHIKSDAIARSFIWLAMCYLIAGLILGVIGGFQYVLPSFLKDQLTFQKTRPLHVYLVISWIFSGAQAGIYYYIPRISNRSLYWVQGGWLHVSMQMLASVFVIFAFFLGRFSGREYLEFPPWLGFMIIFAWVPFALNFFLTLRPDYRKAPVYIWSWSVGIIFFFLTMLESYLWVFEFFRTNIVRDVTIQWKALGSMVGSWNMLVYGCAIYIMEKLSGDEKLSRQPLPFFFFFLGLTNLMFNWGHHTYIVPAAQWVKTVAYLISMTELLILGQIIFKWRKTVSNARKNYHSIPFRLLSLADAWIFLNLTLAITISVPALNYYTHGTHITVAHAMGATIGINTMLLLSSVFYILQDQVQERIQLYRKQIGIWVNVSNIALLVFWLSLIGSGLVQVSGRLNNKGFYEIMSNCAPYFRIFLISGIVVMTGLAITGFIVIRLIITKRKLVKFIQAAH